MGKPYVLNLFRNLIPYDMETYFNKFFLPTLVNMLELSCIRLAIAIAITANSLRNIQMSSNQIAKDIVDKLVNYASTSKTLESNLENAISDAVQKSFKVYAKNFIREICSEDEVDAAEVARALNVSLENNDDWETEVARKLSMIASDKLRRKIQVSIIPESAFTESNSNSPKLELLLG